MDRLKRVIRLPSQATDAEALRRRLAELEAENALLKAAQRRTDAENADADAARRIIKQLYDIVEGARQGIVVHRGGAPFYANLGLVQMLGLPSRGDYMRAESVLDYVHPDDRPLVVDYVGQFLQGADLPPQGEFRLVRADGAVLWVDSITSRIVWDGEPAILSSMTDITARRETERELQRSQKLFATVFQASPVTLSLTDMSTGHYIDVNDAFLALIGARRDEVIGKNSVQLGVWVDPDAPRRLKQMLGRQGIARDVEAAIRCRDGETRDLLISAEVIRVEGKDLLLGVGRDITARKGHDAELRRSKEAAELANRSKSEFLANMSHELRTPLNAILGFSEVIRDQLFGAIGEARYAEYARDIHASGQHLLQIINDLLDLSKLEAGKLELHEDEVELPPLIEDCVRLVRGRADTAGLKLKVAPTAALPRLRADARLLRQILINLLSNATKFTPEGGSIAVSARLARDRGIEIDVADTGIGMSEADIEVALTPFGQVDGSLSRRHEGTGLGLPLVRALTELHGGALVIRSTPGTGTTVSIRLPAARVIAGAG